SELRGLASDSEAKLTCGLRGLSPARVRESGQRAEGGEVAQVALLVVAQRGLEDHRDVRESWLGEEAREGVEAEQALAEVGVAVLARAFRADRVVDVDAADRVEADGRLDLGEEVLEPLRVVERVAGGE